MPITNHIYNCLDKAYKQGMESARLIETTNKERMQIQEVLNELNKVLGLTIVVENGVLKAGKNTLFEFSPCPTLKSFPIIASLGSQKVTITNQCELVAYLSDALRNPAIAQSIQEQHYAQQ